MTGQPWPEREVRVGVVGPHELVERIMLSGLPGAAGADTQPLPPDSELELRRRLVMAPYLSEHEAAEKVARIGNGVDAFLFASRISLEQVRRAGVLTGPATCIQLGGTTLYAALLQARRDGLDPGRASYDGLSRAELDVGLTEIGVPADGTHVREDATGAAAIASFHERLWRLGQTTAAFTCVEQTARRLAGASVPVVRLRPTDRAIRSALQVATLLAAHRSLADSQLAVALVEVAVLRDSPRRSAPRQAREELALTVHRFLVRETQRIQATVSQVGEYVFLVLATRGTLAAAGDPPFGARARAALGIALDVGVGIGRSEYEAEARARLELGQARMSASGQQSVSGGGTGTLARRSTGQGARINGGAPEQGSLRSGPAKEMVAAKNGLRDVTGPLRDSVPQVPRAADSLSRLRALETLSRLAQKLAADSAPVVDAELTGKLLSVTPRTARRQLRALVDEGLALPLPPARRPHPGRPRLAYRLVVEKLDRRAP